MKPRLEELRAFLGENFGNKDKIAGLSLKYKGLKQPKAKRYYGGRKIWQDFILPNEDKVAVRVNYEDIIENGIITQIKKTVVYYSDFDCGIGSDELGYIWHIKEEFDIVRNELSLKKSRISWAYDRLAEVGLHHTDPNVRAVFTALLSFFNDEVQIWVLGNNIPFVDRLNANDLPQNIIDLLSLEIEAGKTVKDGILEQVTGVPFNN